MNVLDTYKAAWQDEKAFNESRLSDQEIKSYLEKRSARIDGMYRSGLLFDLVIKTILLAALAGLALVFQLSSGSSVAAALAGATLLGGLMFEGRIYLQISRVFTPSAPIKAALRERIDFFNRRYLKSLLVVAISSPLMILVGGMYYFYFKYGEIRPLDLEDIIVFSLILIAGYSLSTFFQVRNFRFHIRQLEDALAGFNEESLNMEVISLQRRQRKRIIILTLLAIIVGILSLLLLLIQ